MSWFIYQGRAEPVEVTVVAPVDTFVESHSFVPPFLMESVMLNRGTMVSEGMVDSFVPFVRIHSGDGKGVYW